jgi:hypothetical protein
MAKRSAMAPMLRCKRLANRSCKVACHGFWPGPWQSLWHCPGELGAYRLVERHSRRAPPLVEGGVAWLSVLPELLLVRGHAQPPSRRPGLRQKMSASAGLMRTAAPALSIAL